MQHVSSRIHDEINILRKEVQDMLRAAEAAYQDAAANHFMSRVLHHGGRISALKAVIDLIDSPR
jgi:hypothetical protein